MLKWKPPKNFLSRNKIDENQSSFSNWGRKLEDYLEKRKQHPSVLNKNFNLNTQSSNNRNMYKPEPSFQIKKKRIHRSEAVKHDIKKQENNAVSDPEDEVYLQGRPFGSKNLNNIEEYLDKNKAVVHKKKFDPKQQKMMELRASMLSDLGDPNAMEHLKNMQNENDHEIKYFSGEQELYLTKAQEPEPIQNRQNSNGGYKINNYLKSNAKKRIHMPTRNTSEVFAVGPDTTENPDKNEHDNTINRVQKFQTWETSIKAALQSQNRINRSLQNIKQEKYRKFKEQVKNGGHSKKFLSFYYNSRKFSDSSIGKYIIAKDFDTVHGHLDSDKNTMFDTQDFKSKTNNFLSNGDLDETANEIANKTAGSFHCTKIPFQYL